MKRSVYASLGFHALILGAALITLPAVDAFKAPPIDAIQVDISQIQDQSKRKAVTTEVAEKKPVPAPKKTEVAKVEPAPKVAEEIKTAVKEAAPEPELKPEPKKEVPKPEPPKAEDKPVDPDPMKELLAAEAKKLADEKAAAEKKKKEEQKKVEDKKKAEEKKIAERKKREDDKKKLKDKIAEAAAFLNKTDDEKTAPMKSAEKAGTPEKGEKAMVGTDDAVAGTIVEYVTSKIRNECFTVPPAARDADIAVPVRFTLSEDGMVVSVDASPGSDPIYQATAAAAVSAVKQCEPYDLPADKFDIWKQGFEIDFNPNMMSRS